MSKVIVITGGSAGLGKEIARKLSKDNQVVILARNQQELAVAAKEIGCDFFACDVSKLDQIQHAVSEISKKHKQIDVLINNAGIWIQGELDSNDPGYIKQVLEVNTLAAIWFSQTVIPLMKKQGSGSILNVISQAGLRPKEERSVYTASKYALTGFTDSLNLELGKYGIAVSAIYPYKMNTKMFEAAGVQKEMDDALDPAVVADAVVYMLSQQPPNLITHLEIKNNSYKNKV